MSTTTALQLVNRFLRKHRRPDVADFSSPEATHALDFINDAKEEVLDPLIWNFDRREADLYTLPVVTLTSGLVTNGNTGVVGTISDSTFTPNGAFSARIIVTSDATYPDTAFRAEASLNVAALNTTVMEEAWLGTTNASTATATLFWPEYQFPKLSNGDSVVRELLSMRHQEEEIRLESVYKDRWLDGRVVRPHDDISADFPHYCYLTDVKDTSSDLVTPSNTWAPGFGLWPVPEGRVALTYTYVQRRAPLSATTDTMDGVPEEVLNTITQIAFGRSMQSMFGNDPALGDRILIGAFTRRDALHKAQKDRAPRSNRSVPSLDAHSGTFSHRRLPDTEVSL